MQYSTNYNLNLVEGTDIVNPLVIDKPNYITIDTQMKDNEDAGVGTATEIKTGTVHALTRSNGDNNVFRYVATSVCNAGDTFTVDGVNVTALLPTGEALGNNAYTIGCNVLAILTSTELTIFTGGGTASNAAMLNSQLPSYYLDARNESFDNTGTDLSATNTEAAIKEVNSKTNINNNFATRISIESYNTAGNMYTFPDDGYVSLGVTTLNKYSELFLVGNNGDTTNTRTPVLLINGTGTAQRIIVSVKKGMQCYIDSTDNVSQFFFPLQ